MRNLFSSQPRKIAIILVVTVIAAFGLAAAQIAVDTGNKLKAAQNRIADLESRLALQGEKQGSSLADAMQLVPMDSVVTGGSRLSGRIYWVSAETVDQDGHPAVQFWAVDVPAATATLIVQRNFSGADVVTSIDTSSVADEYATIETQASAEGSVETYMDAVDVRTGQLLTSVHWENGSRISVLKDGQTLDLSLPADLCKGRAAGSIVNVPGLMVQGSLIKLSHTASVECIEDAFTDTMRPADLGMPLYSRSLQDGGETVEITLPWGDTATVDVQNLRPSGVSFAAE